jgi:hypothetical protein
MFHTENRFRLAVVALPRSRERKSGQPGKKDDPMGAPTLLLFRVIPGKPGDATNLYEMLFIRWRCWADISTLFVDGLLPLSARWSEDSRLRER